MRFMRDKEMRTFVDEFVPDELHGETCMRFDSFQLRPSVSTESPTLRNFNAECLSELPFLMLRSIGV